MNLLPNLSVADIVTLCSLDIEKRIDVERAAVGQVGQKASDVKSSVDCLRIDLSLLHTATEKNTPLHQRASHTLLLHQQQEQPLDQDLLRVEQELQAVRPKIEAETTAARRHCGKAALQITAGRATSTRVQKNTEDAAQLQSRAQVMIDAVQSMRDGLLSLARRQQQ